MNARNTGPCALVLRRIHIVNPRVVTAVAPGVFRELVFCGYRLFFRNKKLAVVTCVARFVEYVA